VHADKLLAVTSTLCMHAAVLSCFPPAGGVSLDI
jgi:hypothetical protein